MSKVFCALIAALCLTSIPVAAETADAKATKETPKAEKVEPKAEKKEDPDTLKIYRTKGNTWTLKLADGTFEKHEVTEVTDKKASIKLSTLDKDRKETNFDFYSVSLKDKAKADNKTPSKIEDEKLTIGGAAVECTHAQFYSSGGTLHIWTAKDLHFVVKEEWVTKAKTETRREVVELSAK